jgi:hypothetical protein
MGDVSQLMPAVHAYFAIGPEDLPGHSVALAAAAAGPAGDAAVINGAKALGMTVADLLAAPGLLERARTEYSHMLEVGQVAGWDRWHAAGQSYEGAPV